jgi:hypothetical protein
MAPFEALYGRKCRTPLFWNQTGESQVFGTDVLRNAEDQVRVIHQNLRWHNLVRRVMLTTGEGI